MNPRLERLSAYRRILDRAREQGESHFIEAQRKLCRADLFYLLLFPLKRKDINRDWLFERCCEVQASPNGHLDLWAREHYKALRLDEPVPTPSGWARHGDLKPDDWVFGPDGQPTRVVAVSKVFDEAPAFELVFDDGSRMEASRDHLWQVEARSRRRITGGRAYREPKVIATEEIAAISHRPDKRLAIPVNAPLDMPEAILPIGPYTLGCWLGDGTSADGSITFGDADIAEGIQSEGFKIGPANRLRRTVYGLSPLLRGLGLIGSKATALPMDYLRGSEQQRLALLRGLMDTDGHCNTRGTATFTNKTGVLATLVFDLATSLGMKPVKREYRASHGTFWQVSFQAYQAQNPFHIRRKAERAKPGSRNAKRFIISCKAIGRRAMSCIQVERADGLYLAGRQMVTTHNSTIITFAKTIQDILIDPEVTIGIFSHTRAAAKGFLRPIKAEFENNDDLKRLFSDILWMEPKKQAPKWSENEGLIVKRTGNPKEATLECWGLVEGMPTGKHFMGRVYDDVIDQDSVRNPDAIRRTTGAWELSLNLGKVGGWERYIGTRYHYADPYREMMARGSVKPRIHTCTVEGTFPGTPVLMPADVLAKKRRDQGIYTFSSQMLQDPTADKKAGFKEEWLRYYSGRISGDRMVKYLLCDPANAKKKDSDFTAMGVIGLGPDQNYYLLDGIRDRLSLTERWQALSQLHRRWRPKGVGYEQYGLQSDLQHFETQMTEEEYRFEITPLGGGLAKHDRIRKLVPLFEAGRFWLPEVLVKTDYEDRQIDIVQMFVDEEYKAFPVAMHEDFFDMLARIEDPALDVKWPKPDVEDESSRYALRKRRRQRAPSAWAS
ncbi:hypothetical protein [uncultured Devosia sp.]|uniref:hypothetical protein n=1 Tax=uncultured Devosia sp. TaxID=211434 RepID=UPI00261FF8F6|nr:hypothetical protein [uncultured Devosia sp.]